MRTKTFCKTLTVMILTISILLSSMIIGGGEVEAAGPVCPNCGETRTRLYSHTNPTCTTQGFNKYYCMDCTLYWAVPIAATGHNYKWETIKAPSCTTMGVKKGTCTICGTTRTLNVAATGHNMRYAHYAATCTEGEKWRGYCQRSGCSYSQTTYSNPSTGKQGQAALGHNYVNGVCSRCRAQEDNSGSSSSSSSTPSTNTHVHTWISADCKNQKRCSCGATSGSALGHNYVNGVCTRCGEKQTSGTISEWKIGYSVTATLDAEGTLTISGDGRIYNYDLPIEGATNICPITNKSKIKKVNITGKVTNIGSYLFYYCTNLESITIQNPDQIDYIGEGAFFGCKKLKRFSVPKNIIAIGPRAFCHCESLESIDLSAATKLARIGHEAFRDCWSLQNVYMPEGLKVIGYETFFNCISLKNVIIPSTVVAMGTLGASDTETGLGTESQVSDTEKTERNTSGYNHVFEIDFSRNEGQEEEYKSYIELVLKRNGVTYDESAELEDLEKLVTETVLSKTRVWYYTENAIMKQYSEQATEKEMKISELKWDISENEDNSIIATLDKDGKLTITGTGKTKDYELGKTPWNDVRKRVKSVEIGEGVTGIGEYLFYWHDELTRVSLPSTLEEIKYGAFFGCRRLPEITIPDKVTSIEGRAFCHCELFTTITLPKGIKNISGEVFRDCYKLEKVITQGDIATIGQMGFFNCPSLSLTVSPNIEEVEEKAFAIDFSVNSDTKYEEVENLTPCEIKYYSDSDVMKEYAEANSSERTFVEVDIDKIEIDTTNVKKTYVVGDTIDLTGLTLKVYYKDGTSREITDEFTYTPTELNTVGTQTITITYGENFTAKFDVEVEEVKMTKIEIKTKPNKTNYIVGETLNTEGLVLSTTYNNGALGEVYEGFTCTPTKLENVGTQTITVTYEGLTTTFDVTVDKESITMTSDVYNISNGYITKVQPNTTLENFKDDVTTNATNIKVYNKNNSEIKDTDAIATGMRLVLDDETTYTLVVLGDVNGDGDANLDDIFEINKHRLNKIQLTAEYLMAGDTNKDNKVGLDDIFQINKYRLGKINTL